MTSNKRTAREMFIEWQKAGHEPKRKSVAVRVVSQHMGTADSDWNCRNINEDVNGKVKLDDRLAFLYWDITENGGRAIGKGYKETNRARVQYVLRIAGDIVRGPYQPIREQAMILSNGKHAKLQPSLFIHNKGYRAIADMSPAALAAHAKTKLKNIKLQWETWYKTNSAPELAIAAMRLYMETWHEYNPSPEVVIPTIKMIQDIMYEWEREATVA